MSLIKKSFQQLFPEKEFQFSPIIKYSKAFNSYNANIRLSKLPFSKNLIELRISHQWKGIDDEIKIGLIQSLLLKLFKEKKTTINIDLYNNFIKNIHIAIPKKHNHPILQESFNRVNNEYFFNLIEMSNLKFNNAINKLGSYEYGTDTITISKYLSNEPQEIIDYIMYHEMLHKKHKFKNKNNKNYHHTKIFRQQEKKFKNSQNIEKQLSKIITKNKIKKRFKLI